MTIVPPDTDIAEVGRAGTGTSTAWQPRWQPPTPDWAHYYSALSG
jgi:hypothetical protein